MSGTADGWPGRGHFLAADSAAGEAWIPDDPV